jgi:hypothetical protein
MRETLGTVTPKLICCVLQAAVVGFRLMMLMVEVDSEGWFEPS